MNRWIKNIKLPLTIRRWISEDAQSEAMTEQELDRIDWLRVIPFLTLHIACLGVLWVGWSPIAVWTAVVLYAIRMLAITGTYHRYFAHRTYEMSRFWQFFFAIIACSAGQKGPLWWASHHRHHHRFADSPEDAHSPKQKGFLYSHMLWVLTPRYFATNKKLVGNWLKFPELSWLNRHSHFPPVALLLIMGIFGALLKRFAPSMGTSALQMMIWGFCISTVVLFHASVTINSVAHMIGRRRYQTKDDSRNNWLLALLTFGEGWHNNHHYYPASARQGFFWWEIDLTYYVLLLLARLGIVQNLATVPQTRRDSNRVLKSGTVPCVSP